MRSSPLDFDYDYFDNPEGAGYRGYHRQGNGDYAVMAWEECAAFCRSNGASSAIDLGCAKGYLVEALLEAGIAAIGYDVSHYALGFATSLPCHYRDIRGPIPGTADAVFALGVLQYVEEEELGTVLKGVFEATGQLFLFSSYYAGGPQEGEDPLRRITRPRAWWQDAISAAGFSFRSREKYFDVFLKPSRARVL
jgi:hypothetical protein